MAGYTYQTRKKITEEWVRQLEQAGSRLSDAEKKLLPEERGYNYVPREAISLVKELCESGKYRTLSGIYRGPFRGLVDVCVQKGQQEEFF